ncbi:MAG TPA: T9SS type A sorting domain-containing protein [Bacteroidia bacterium]|nr:T9SS type A sorting domain-containing protein [Bacteroidia bacterium]
MKRIFFFLLFIISISVEAQTSVYHPFPDSNAAWNIYLYWGCFGNPLEKYYSYTINGDTIINGNNYHKLSVPAVIMTGCSSGGVYPGYSAGYIRQDISNKKVFFVPPLNNDTVEQLLYDFNLVVGDTVKGYLVYLCPSDVITIIAMDSVLINGTFRKRWETTPSWLNGYYFIEGIGSLYGLLESICPGVESPNTSLTCFKQNGLTLYPDSSINCNLIDGIINISGDDISLIEISPNPFHNFINIKNNQAKELSITIFSSIGEVVHRTTLMKDAATAINLSGLAAGIYLVTAQSDKNFTSRKIIKQ